MVFFGTQTYPGYRIKVTTKKKIYALKVFRLNINSVIKDGFVEFKYIKIQE